MNKTTITAATVAATLLLPVTGEAHHLSTLPNGKRWLRVAACESTLRWHLDGLYDGGLQFSPATWNRAKRAYRPARRYRYAYQAPARTQIIVAERLRRRSGLQHWPVCKRYW